MSVENNNTHNPSYSHYTSQPKVGWKGWERKREGREGETSREGKRRREGKEKRIGVHLS